jgi:hypothetical protein
MSASISATSLGSRRVAKRSGFTLRVFGRASSTVSPRLSVDRSLGLLEWLPIERSLDGGGLAFGPMKGVSLLDMLM